MCTVTYLPLGNRDYILTSNRDESPDRNPTLPPGKHIVHNREVYFPKDPMAKGTWIAADTSRFTLCLLNGAFEKHKRSLPYRKSRGIVLLDFFELNDVDAYVSTYDFRNIEPFTLVILDRREALTVHELRWDGERVHHQTVASDQPLIWASVTLYNEAILRQRRNWFDTWLENNPVFEQEAILDFHSSGGNGDQENGIVMNRNDRVKTLSITSVRRSGEEGVMIYRDLVNAQTHQLSLAGQPQTQL